MQTDVKAVSLAASGDISAYPTRVRGLVVEPGASAGSVVVKDGGSGGTTVMTLNTVASATQPTYLIFPGEGVLFSTNVHGTVTNVTSVTIFYG